ncbi:beta-carotene 15,15'-monooxygenase [Kaistella sp.]|uniref:beta-carotene 15,15'-monooxygenase n=1 Tax=Kaistella sp. TaxID=2782235 RepID=UPI00359F6C13
MDTFEEFDQPIGPEKSAGAIIAHAFEIYKGIFMYGIAAVLLTSLISFLVQPISGFNSGDLMEEMKDNGDTFPSLWQVPGFTLYAGLSGLISLLLTPIYVGLIYIAKKYNLQEKISFGDLFIGFKQNFVNIIIYALISSIIIALSVAMCVIPVFFVFPLLLLGYPILLFENATFSEALSKSFSIAKDNYGTFLGAALLGFLISIAGAALCGIGIIFTFSFYLIVMYSAYCAFCGRPRPIILK